MRIERCAVAMLLFVLACGQPAREAKKLAKAAVPVPQIQATVVTIRTTVQPPNQTTTTTLVIGGELARIANEVGTWRMFDVKNGRVAFVDDFAKTFRWVSLADLEQQPDPPDDGAPRAQFTVTSVRRLILNIPATQAFVRLGGYQRELWIGSHPLIPGSLFPLIDASNGSTEHLLAGVRGFPLAEHAELPYGKSKLVVDREVASVERKNVPQALLQIPATYKDLTATGPAARRPASSSRPRGQRTPEEELRSSATDRKGP